MKIREIRRLNLAQLIKDHANNNQRQLSELIDKPASLISQIINDTRGMGEKIARGIEDSLSIERYSLDKPPLNDPPTTNLREEAATYITPQTIAVLNRLRKLAETKALTDADFALINQLVDRFQKDGKENDGC